MSNEVKAELIFESALEAFPYPLQATSITQGDITEVNDNFVEYGEEFTFEAGKLFDEQLVAGGWIEYRQEEELISISAFFGIARNGDWKDGSILKEHEVLRGYFDLETKKWELSIDTY